MRLLTLLIIASLTLFVQSCASSYTVSDPSTRAYLSNDTQEGVTLHYKYNVLTKKYAKKETKKDMKVVAVKIENNSDSYYTVGRNLTVTNDKGFEYTLFENEQTFKSLKQKPASHLFYLLLTPLNLSTTKTQSNGVTTVDNLLPVGLVLGPAITGINMIVSSSANKKFKEDLSSHNLLGKTIQPGETVEGLLVINTTTYEGLRLNLK